MERFKEAGGRAYVSVKPNKEGGYNADVAWSAYAEDSVTLQAAEHATAQMTGVIGAAGQRALAQRDIEYRELTGLSRRELENRSR